MQAPTVPTPPRPQPGQDGVAPSRSADLLVSDIQRYLPNISDQERGPSNSLASEPQDRFVQWYRAGDLISPAAQTLPQRWEEAFPTQLKDWRERSQKIRASRQPSGQTHGMLEWQTWMFPVGVPLGESIPADKPQPPRERLVLVCLPPGEVIQEGDRVMVADPRNLDRPPQASQMPLEVLTVPDSTRLLLPQELDSLAWAASEDREALVGEVLRPPSPEKS